MLKVSTLALAATLSVVFLAPIPAKAIDNGPCDHCTMEPIVVKGDRKKNKGAALQIRPVAQRTVLASLR